MHDRRVQMIRSFYSAIKAATVFAVTVLMLAVPASAATFNGSFQNSGSAFTDPGLVINTNPTNGSFMFDLEPGESTTFSLFDIFTPEVSVNADDRVPQTLTTTFAFTSPDLFGGDTDGTTVGTSYLLGMFQEGSVTWNDPLELTFGNGGSLRLGLSNETFNEGLFDLSCGQCNGVVDLTATYTSASVTPVPLPAAGWLLLASIGGLAALRRRKQLQTA